MTAFAAQGWTMEGDNWVYIDSSGNRVTDAWKKSGDNWFYLDSSGDMARSSVIEYDDDYYYVNSVGAMVSNEWREIPSDYEEEDSPETYWYYFQNNGKAYKASSSGKTSFKSIRKANGEWKKYAFDSEGRMLFGWVGEDSERITGDDAWREGVYYCGNSDDGAQVLNAWSLQEVDDPDTEEDNFDGTYWFYFGTNGKKIKDTTKTINGLKYRFNENGAAESEWYAKASTTTASGSNLYYNLPEHGLYMLTFDDDKKIDSYEEIEAESDLPDSADERDVYYFGDSPKEGVMATGKTTIDIDGEKYTYNFRKSGSDKGAGYNGIYDDSIYIKGRLLKADRDAKYEVVSYNGEDYLIGTSGKLAKGKKNLKNGDDKYFSTNKQGIVTYEGYEKE